MKKRESFKQKQRRQQAQRRRLVIIGGVVLLAVIVVLVLILQNPRSQAVGSFVTVSPQTWPDANGKSMGPAGAKVVVQEYADFQCPYCREFHDSVLTQIIKQYVATGKIRVEYHHYLVIDQNTGGNESHRAAEASECASEQGRFWDYYNILFTNQGTEASGAFSDARLKAFAASLGLNTTQFNSCLDSGKYTSAVNQDNAQAAALKLPGTPALLVNGTQVENPLNYSQVQAAIDAALKKVGQ